MSDEDAAGTLSTRHRQILDFVAAYVAEEGYVPAVRAIAQGCGLRSSTSVRRVLQDLEAAGLIERDPDRPRLAQVHLPRHPDEPGPEGLTLNDELVLCDSTAIEMRAAVEAARRGLAFAHDLDSQEVAHREALARIQLCRVYDDARDRMVRRGARLPTGVEETLAQQRLLAADRLDLIISWATYSAYSLLMELAVRDFLAGPESLGWVHLRPAYAAELTLIDPERRPDLKVLRERLAAGDRALDAFCVRYVANLRQTAELLRTSLPERVAATFREFAENTLEETVARFRTPDSAF